jgi:hypothetical protein
MVNDIGQYTVMFLLLCLMVIIRNSTDRICKVIECMRDDIIDAINEEIPENEESYDYENEGDTYEGGTY